MYSHVAVAVIAAASAWFVQGWRYDANELKRVEAARELKRNNDKGVDTAAAGHESDKKQIITKYVTVTETVTKIVDRPIYQNICLDQDGLDAINGKVKP